ncbi:MAG: helix-turn-helix domain-containing protein [Clostridiales bacterium]|nr:helix-turn-helix domain-containing protein [Clostridiales bacterium]
MFKEQVKISLSSYIVLIKMQKAAKYVLYGESLTTAALHAGFSGSAHMASTCKRMFGIALSEIFAAY